MAGLGLVAPALPAWPDNFRRSMTVGQQLQALARMALMRNDNAGLIYVRRMLTRQASREPNCRPAALEVISWNSGCAYIRLIIRSPVSFAYWLNEPFCTGWINAMLCIGGCGITLFIPHAYSIPEAWSHDALPHLWGHV